jgi:hypothetical protein
VNGQSFAYTRNTVFGGGQESIGHGKYNASVIQLGCQYGCAVCGAMLATFRLT